MEFLSEGRGRGGEKTTGGESDDESDTSVFIGL